MKDSREFVWIGEKDHTRSWPWSLHGCHIYLMTVNEKTMKLAGPYSPTVLLLLKSNIVMAHRGPDKRMKVRNHTC